MHHFAILSILITSIFTFGFTLRQQNAVEYINFQQEYEFGEILTITGTINSMVPVTKAVLYLEPLGDATQTIEFLPNENSEIKISFNLNEQPIRAFTPIEYWFEVKLASGDQVSSPVYSFLYEDNRFTWQNIETDNFWLSWADGDNNFGAALKNAAADGLEKAQEILPVKIPAKLRIVVYPDSMEMQSATQGSASPWAAGHANPDINLILVSVAPGPDARAEMERQIPHEIMHILEYQVAESAYNQIPTWLLEGLASNAELYPNPEYQRILEKAVDDDALLPMSVLCQEFPRDLSGAILAYAQSNSFVQFLKQNFGSRDILSLLNLYADGLSCEVGVQAAFGSKLNVLEARWQQEMLGRSPVSAAWKQLWPYILIAGLVIVPISLTLKPSQRPKK